MSAPELLIDHGGHVLVIYKTGRRYMHAIALGHPVHTLELELQARRRLAPLERDGRPYPLPRALRLFRKSARELGITKTALRALRSIERGAA